MKVSVVTPTLDEEQCIERVIRGIRSTLGEHTEIIVVDSGTDRTAEIARSLGVTLLHVDPVGTGYSLRAGFQAARGDVILTVDCDGTYPMSEAPRLLEEIANGWDIVGASRMSRRSENMPALNYFGNRVFAFFTRLLYDVQTRDVTTGMRAYRGEVLRSISWQGNFDLPVELLVRSVRLGYRYQEIDITYQKRSGGKSKLRKWMGLPILWCILKWRWVNGSAPEDRS